MYELNKIGFIRVAFLVISCVRAKGTEPRRSLPPACMFRG